LLLLLLLPAVLLIFVFLQYRTAAEFFSRIVSHSTMITTFIPVMSIS
jgi:hypothetical protein